MTASCQCVLQFSHPICLKYCARSCEVLHLSRKIIFAYQKLSIPEMSSLSRNQRPDPRKYLMEMSLVVRLPPDMHIWRSSNAQHLQLFLEIAAKTSRLADFVKVQNPLQLLREITIEAQKWREHVFSFHILTSICAGRHSACTF